MNIASLPFYQRRNQNTMEEEREQGKEEGRYLEIFAETE